MKLSYKVTAVDPVACSLTVQLIHDETGAVIGTVSWNAANVSTVALRKLVVGQTYPAHLVRYL